MPVGSIRGARAATLGGLFLVFLPLGGCWPGAPDTGGDRTARPAAVTLQVLPDDGADAITQLIQTASRSIAVEMYLLTDRSIIDGLITARQAGRDVRVILEANPFGAAGANQAAFDRLAAAGADVRWASARFALTHTKVLVADGRHAAVMTSNLTHAGLATNREYLILDDTAADLDDLQAILAADSTGADPPPSHGRIVASPDGSRAALLALIAGARTRLEVEMEELSDPAAVTALTEAAAAGVVVTVVAPAQDRSAATSAALARLVGAGVSVRVLSAPTVHAKAIVADGGRLYVGSINLTAASLDRNREIGVIVDDDAAARRVAATIAADAAAGVAF